MSRITRLAFAAAFALSIGPASAAPITFTWEGEVTAVPVADPGDPFGGLLAPGATFTLTYAVDPAVAVDGAPDPSTGSYESTGALDLSFTIGSVAFGPYAPFTVTTFDAGIDFYGVLAIAGPLQLSVSLIDGSGAALSSDALPSTAAALAGFFTAGASRTFDLFYDDSAGSGLQYQVQGSVSSLCVGGTCVGAVPVAEPGSLALLAAAATLAAAGLRRRRG